MKHSVILLFVILFSALSADIVSSGVGVNWSDPVSWIGGAVPGPTDNVTINNLIQVDYTASCHNLTVTGSGAVQNYPYYGFTLNVLGNLNNAGSITNQPYGGQIFLRFNGHLTNTGVLTPQMIYLGGNANQQLASSGTLASTSIVDENSASPVTLMMDLALSSVSIDMNYAWLILNSAFGSFDLSMSGGYLQNVDVTGGNGSTLTMYDGSYLNNASCDELVTDGSVIVLSATFGTLINAGTLINYAYNNSNLTVNQRLENHGSISNHPYGGNLQLYLAGDLYDHGTLDNFAVYLTNSISRNLWQSPEAPPIGCGSFHSLAQDGYQALTDLRFSNCSLNLNGQSLSLQQGGQDFGLELNGGVFTNAVVHGGNTSFMSLENNAWLSYLAIDRIVWQGTVIVAEGVAVGWLRNQGSLTNYGYNNYSLTINQRLENHGSISNHPYGGYLYVYLAGDLFNYGYLANYTIYLNNTVQSSLYQDPGAYPIACQNFHSQYALADYQALSDLHFSNSDLNLDGRILRLSLADQDFGLHLNGGRFTNAVVDGGDASYMYLEGSAWISYLTIDRIIWQGTVIVAEGVVVDDLVNQGDACNYGYSNYFLTVNQRLENQGSIYNHIYGGYFSIYLAGDLYDYWSIANHAIYFTNTQLCHIYQDPSAAPISCQYFHFQSVAADYQALSNLSFTGCSVNLNGRTLMLYNGRSSYGLTLGGGHLTNGMLDTDGFGFLNLYGNAFISYIQAGDMILHGEVICAENIVMEDVVVYGNVYNYVYGSYSLVATGDLINYGSVSNHIYGGTFYLYCHQDLTNYGYFGNHRVVLNGTQNQHFQDSGTFAASGLILVSEIGSALWHFNGGLASPNWMTEIAINPAILGVWQPINAAYGRLITIGTGAATLAVPADVRAYVANGEAKIRWNQVPGAVYYNLYRSAAPEGPFFFHSHVFDTDVNDGLVKIELPIDDAYGFFQVTAGN